METKERNTTPDCGVPPMGELFDALFAGFAPAERVDYGSITEKILMCFAPVTDYETDARDCANYLEPLKDEEDEQ